MKKHTFLLWILHNGHFREKYALLIKRNTTTMKKVSHRKKEKVVNWIACHRVMSFISLCLECAS